MGMALGPLYLSLNFETGFFFKLYKKKGSVHLGKEDRSTFRIPLKSYFALLLQLQMKLG